MLKTFLVTTLILCSAVQGSPISADESKSGQQSTATLRDTLSERLLKYMNESVDPCDNFFEFACGNWRTHYPASESRFYTSSIDLEANIFYGKVAQLLNTPPTQTDTEAELKVKNFYESCLSFTSLSTTDYREKLLEIMAEFGQMPALIGDECLEQDFDWMQTVIEISHKYYINIILGYYIYPNKADHTANLLTIKCERTKRQDSQYIAHNLVTFLGMDQEIAIDVAREIVEFDSYIVYASQGGDGNLFTDDILYLRDLYVHQLFNYSFGHLNPDDIYCFCDLPTLIYVVYQFPKRVVANYIFYQLLEPFILRYPEDKTQLAKGCLSVTLTHFPHIVSFMFYRSNYLTEKENYVEYMWQDMRATLQTMLESSRLRWMDDVTRESALEKLHSIQMAIPLYKENHFDEEYDQLSMKKNDYLEIVKSLASLSAAKTRASLDRQPQHIDNNLGLYSPFYMPVSNIMVIPVTVLATDFSFSTLYPKAVNFGHVGFSLGHEAIHGFTAIGRHYNKLGNFVGKWGDKVEKEYDERRQCFYDQYHNYTIDGKPLPQDQSQGENLADIVGILVAYETYRRWYEDSARSEEELAMETLPNLNYTSQQLFFITYAQGWCEDAYEGFAFRAASADVHSPGKFRAFVPLTNIEEFANAFECPRGSAMNPEKQCSIK